jgi:excisionase family DNA binding protein
METKVNKNDLANQEVLAELEMLSKKEVAGLLKVSTSTLDRWVRAGLLKCVKLGKNVQQARVYFHRSDILEFKNKNYGYR